MNLKFLLLRKFRLTKTSFQGLHQLERLVLNECDFKQFKSESFRHLSNLEGIQISTPLNFSKINLKELTELKWLRMHDLPSTEVLDQASPSLIFLYVDFSRYFKYLNKDEYFKHLKHDHLETIHVQFGRFDNFIDGKWFSGLTKLKSLRLNGTEYPDDKLNLSYEFLTHRLETLDIRLIPIFSLDNTFSALVNLKRLNLNLTCCREITSNAFKGLKRLEKLKLVGFRAPGVEIPLDWFIDLENLTDLTLNCGFLDHIESEWFVYSPKLERLDLVNNRIRELEMDTFVNLKNLRTLDLSANEIEEIGDGVFGHLKRLVHLNLSHNPIRELRARSFDGLGDLKQLSLIDLHADFQLDVGLFKPNVLPSLQVVNVSKRLEAMMQHGLIQTNHAESNVKFIFD